MEAVAVPGVLAEALRILREDCRQAALADSLQREFAAVAGRVPLSEFGHGLWYVTRDDRTVVRLDLALEPVFSNEPDVGVQDVNLRGAERAVMRALLAYAMAMLDRADAQRGGQR